MKRLFSGLFLILLCRLDDVLGQQKADRICTTSRFDDQCAQLQRGNSEVNCQRVQDSIECAQRIRNGTAEFGIFSAESALLVANLKWDGLTVIKQLRHRERIQADADYESVVIVRAGYSGGINGLNGSTYCHPGLHYDRRQRWSERFLKHFERTVVPVDCEKEGLSPAQIETAALAKFFREACRPGQWSNNLEEDAQLKAEYPQLCKLCSNQTACEYEHGFDPDINGPVSSHISAMHCLKNQGEVAYVSLQEAKRFFATNNEGDDGAIGYAYLCPNGTKQSILNNESPCVWLRQPWKLIISSQERSVALASRIRDWVRGAGPGSGIWETGIREILTADSYVVLDTSIEKPADYFRPYREVPFGLSLCSTQSSWCTTSTEEKEKCEVVRAVGITTGVYPVIECRDPSSNTVSCLNDVNSGRADFTGIDSNFGFIARYPYNLTTALYVETETEKYASVVVVVRANSTYERFENLRNAKACFAEFGSIASIAFINTGKNRGFFKKNQCHYGYLLSDFFGPSCAPGALDVAHDPRGLLNGLCSLCRTNATINGPAISAVYPSDVSPPLIRNEDDVLDSSILPTTDGIERFDDVNQVNKEVLNCNADATNKFYGNEGALRCLNEAGDVAVLELQYLKYHAEIVGINPQDYRIMCRNGSLAEHPGFDVDPDCPLTTIVDGEVVVSRNSRKVNGIVNALISLDKYLQLDPDFKMYNIFSGHRDLLFKDSSLGLASRSEEKLSQSVQNYRALFENLDKCVDGNSAYLSHANTNLLISTVALVIFSSLLI